MPSRGDGIPGRLPRGYAPAGLFHSVGQDLGAHRTLQEVVAGEDPGLETLRGEETEHSPEGRGTADQEEEEDRLHPEEHLSGRDSAERLPGHRHGIE